MWSRLFNRLKGTPAPQDNKAQANPWKSSKMKAHSPQKIVDAVPLSPIVDDNTDVRRHFFNEARFQCYASFFAHWDGWITAGHCMSDAQDHIPPFASRTRNGSNMIKWPDGLDAALIGCRLPATPPRAPKIGEAVIAEGFPAGSRNLETRRGKVYFQRSPGTWIMHISDPDEPVVTGMSGGQVRSLDTGEVLGIIITRNSPADLDRDRDPDESCDFTALADVWQAVRGAPLV